MNKFAKTIMLVLLLLVIPARIWAQDYRNHENGFIFNVFEIENVEERVQLASALATSDIWLCNPTENPGELFIRPNSYNADIPIYAEFDYLRATLREEYEEALLLSKEGFAEVFGSWARNISHEYYNFLISDHLDRANHCMDAEPFCTSDVYNFPALNSGYSWSGPNYGCLGSSPTNKHSFWYYMRIGLAGNITIKIEANFDVDFALWGPFENQTDPCPTQAGESGLLTANCSTCPNNTSDPNFYPSGNLHDCSFDARHYEFANVVNGQVGQYYILLITNYSGDDGYITFQKYAGDGETDCGIMPGIVSNGGPYCVGETIQLNVNEQNNATYSWVGPDGWTSDLQSPTRPNCTMSMAGNYECTTTVGNQSVTASTQVTIYPQPTANFDFTNVCIGQTTQFSSTSTTNPSGQQIQNYQWDFGDGETADGQSAVNHTYANAGEYQVTLTVGTTGGLCTDQLTQTVSVYALPAIEATANPSTVNYGYTATLTAQVEGQGNYSYQWEPANMVVSPNASTTQTVPLTASQSYTLTVTNLATGCSSTTQVAVVMAGSDLTATATADQYELCENGSTTLHAQPLGGTANYTYSWSGPNNFTSSQQNPTVSPSVGTNTYSCHIGDGITETDVNVTIQVWPIQTTVLERSFCKNETFPFFGEQISTEGTYYHTLHSIHGCDSIIELRLAANPIDTVEVSISAEGNCDVYVWDPEGHEIIETDHPGNEYTVSNSYHRKYKNMYGCDSLVTMNIQFSYTPTPSEIFPLNPDNTSPHWVITATEFQINSYDFHLWDDNGECFWDSVVWRFESDIPWLVEPFEEDFKKCKIYVLNHVEDTVWLRATAYNDCTSEGVWRRYWFVCSFYGTDDHQTQPASFDVVPNPNNGQMTLHFNHLTGKTNVKVYDMLGNLIDSFETFNQDDINSMQYDMRQRAKGIFFFVATSKEGTVAKKVIIE